jgi:DNA-binding XRE family transcriptional regulator
MRDGGPLADRVAELTWWIASGLARGVRVGAGLSQAVVAQDCEVTPSVMHRWETGQRRPRGRNAATYHRFLARLLGGGERVEH